MGEELRENEEEREKLFPTFLGGELEVFPKAQHHCPPTSRVSGWEQASYQQSAAGGAASSPNEESPPSSQTQSDAPGEDREMESERSSRVNESESECVNESERESETRE